MEAWDDVKGGGLKYGEVAEARREEIEFMMKRGIWEVIPIRECWEKTGKAPTGVRWVDTNKGDEERTDVRSRLVARDFSTKADKGRDDLFAGTPPLEAVRMQFSRAVTRRKRGRGLRKIMFIEARKAHLNPRCTEDVFIELPEEAGAGSSVCGKLRYWLYGFKKAAQAWEDFHAEKLEKVGFVRGQGSGVVFYNEERDISCVCHGDDFTLVAEES
jgi:hypothetical protein